MDVTFQLAPSPDAAGYGGQKEGCGSAGALDRAWRLEALRLAMERRTANDSPKEIICVAREFYEFILEEPKARLVNRAKTPVPSRAGKA